MDVGNIIMFNKQKIFFGIPYNFFTKKIYIGKYKHIYIVNMLIYLCINMEIVLRNVFHIAKSLKMEQTKLYIHIEHLNSYF